MTPIHPQKSFSDQNNNFIQSGYRTQINCGIGSDYTKKWEDKIEIGTQKHEADKWFLCGFPFANHLKMYFLSIRETLYWTITISKCFNPLTKGINKVWLFSSDLHSMSIVMFDVHSIPNISLEVTPLLLLQAFPTHKYCCWILRPVMPAQALASSGDLARQHSPC